MSKNDPTYSSVTAVLGDSRRESIWHLTDELDVFAACGRARFDLRQVETSETDVVEISVTCILGKVSFVVPHGTMVVLDGSSFLAVSRSEVAAVGSSDLPRIEITATTVFGSVRVISDDDPLAADHTIVETAEADEPATEPAADDTETAPATEPAADDTEAA